MEKSRLEKYREERARHLTKIAAYQKRVRALDQKIMEGENLEIRALMKEESLTLEELMAMVKRMQEQRRENSGGEKKPALEPPAQYDAPPYHRPAYAATFNALEDENE